MKHSSNLSTAGEARVRLAEVCKDGLRLSMVRATASRVPGLVLAMVLDLRDPVVVQIARIFARMMQGVRSPEQTLATTPAGCIPATVCSAPLASVAAVLRGHGLGDAIDDLEKARVGDGQFAVLSIGLGGATILWCSLKEPATEEKVWS